MMCNASWGEFENFYNLPPAWNRGLAPVQGKHLQLRPTRNRKKNGERLDTQGILGGDYLTTRYR